MPSVCRGRHRAAEMVRWVLSPSMGSVSSAQAPCGSAVSLPACNAVMGEANRLQYVYTTGGIPRPLSITVQKHHDTEAIHQINLSYNFMGWGSSWQVAGETEQRGLGWQRGCNGSPTLNGLFQTSEEERMQTRMKCSKRRFPLTGAVSCSPQLLINCRKPDCYQKSLSEMLKNIKHKLVYQICLIFPVFILTFVSTAKVTRCSLLPPAGKRWDISSYQRGNTSLFLNILYHVHSAWSRTGSTYVKKAANCSRMVTPSLEGEAYTRTTLYS